MKLRKLGLFCAIGLLVCICAPALRAAPKPSPEQRLTLILLQLTESYDLAGAQTALSELTKSHPKYAEAVFDLGIVAEARRDWREAERAFSPVIQLVRGRPYAVQARVELEKVRHLRQHEEQSGRSVAEYDEAVARARAYQQVGLQREAGVEATVALQLDPKRWEAYAVVGSVRAALHDYEGAGRSLRKAKELAPPKVGVGLDKALASAVKEGQYELLLQTAKEELRGKQYASAANHLLTASQLFPEREMTWYAAATALCSAKRRNDARELLTKLIATGKDRQAVAKATDLLQRIDNALAKVRPK